MAAAKKPRNSQVRSEVRKRRAANAEKRATEVDKPKSERSVRRSTQIDPADKALNPRHSRFVEQYLIDGNAKQAYLRSHGPSANASNLANSLLKRVYIQKAIKAKQKTLADRLGITQEGVLREMKAIAFSNIEDYIEVDEKGEATVNLTAMSRDQAGAISSITTKKYYDKQNESMVTETTLKPYDKKTALEILGKFVGIKGFGNKVELELPDGPLQVEHIHTMNEEQLEQILRGGPKLIEAKS